MSRRAAAQLGTSASTPSARSRSVAPRRRTSDAATGGPSAMRGSITKAPTRGGCGLAMASRGARLGEDEAGGARPDAGLPELPGELAERRALCFASAGVCQQAQRLPSEARARRGPAVELRHDGAPEREVREAHPRHADQKPREQLAH